MGYFWRQALMKYSYRTHWVCVVPQKRSMPGDLFFGLFSAVDLPLPHRPCVLNTSKYNFTPLQEIAAVASKVPRRDLSTAYRPNFSPPPLSSRTRPGQLPHPTPVGQVYFPQTNAATRVFYYCRLLLYLFSKTPV